MDEKKFVSGDLPENCTHTFILKIWLELTAEESSQAFWRGSVIHVGSGKRIYITKLEEFTKFILSYLRAMRVESE